VLICVNPWLQPIFSQPDTVLPQTKTPATGRLQYLAESLETLEDTDIANWKLLIAWERR